MCEALKTLMKDEIAEEKKASVFDAMLNAIKSTMKNTGKDAKQVMTDMGISEAEQMQYLKELK